MRGFLFIPFCNYKITVFDNNMLLFSIKRPFLTRQNKKPKMRKVEGKWIETEEKEWWVTEYEYVRGE